MNNKDSLEDVLFNALQSFSNPNKIWVGLSGGIDSSVLLHALINIQSRIPNKIAAIHINHKLNEAADSWQSHCKKLCAKYNIECVIHEIEETPNNSESIEAWAREVRYQAFAKICSNNDLLLTAQHQDDQAETLLLQLFRGAGPKGLSAMPKIRKIHNYFLGRPFLSIERSQVEEYAKYNKLQWIEDESNDDSRYDRNYLRNTVFPLIKQRWPAAVKTLSRSSEHFQELVSLVEQKTQLDIKSIVEKDTVDIDRLKTFTLIEQKNLIRTWIEHNGYLLPSGSILDQILSSVVGCEQDKMPLVHWQNTDVRRYKNKLYIMQTLDNSDCSERDWVLSNPIQLNHGQLTANLEAGKGIHTELINKNIVKIKYRVGGETIQPVKRKNKHELKKLFQDAEVLPWVRDKIPLIYINNELAAVTGFWVSEKYACLPEQQGWNIVWNTDLRLTA